MNNTFELIGDEYGGRYVPIGLLRHGMTVISAGVGENISFELECAKKGLKIRLYDPTPRSIEYMKQFSDVDGIVFSPVGISKFPGVKKFFLPSNPDHVSCSLDNLQNTKDYVMAAFTTIQTVMSEHGVPDILKLDIEGAEYGVLDRLKTDMMPRVLMVEFHGEPEFDYVQYFRHIYTNMYKWGHDYLFFNDYK